MFWGEAPDMFCGQLSIGLEKMTEFLYVGEHIL